MNQPTRWLLRALVLVLVFDSAGCAWLRHRREGHGAAAEIAIVNTTQAQRRAAQAEADASTVAAAAAPMVAPLPAAPPPLSESEIASVRALAADFHQMHARFAGRGLPDPAAMNAYNAFLCPGLSAALADSAQAGDVIADGEGARVTVALARGVGPGATHWHDDLVLQRDQGIWCVADVAYGGTWPFANKGTLGDMLKAAF